MANPNETGAATRILCNEEISADERAARLLPLVYDQLRAVAQQRMASERGNHTLQPTALVHEAYLRLIGDRKIPWQNRAHFYTAAAEAMRHVLLDHARAKGRIKRGGNEKRVAMNVVDLAVSGDAEEIIALDEALQRLRKENPEAASIVQLRFYAGLSMDETADALNVPRRTLDRRWQFVRAWLFRELGQTDPETGAG